MLLRESSSHRWGKQSKDTLVIFMLCLPSPPRSFTDAKDKEKVSHLENS